MRLFEVLLCLVNVLSLNRAYLEQSTQPNGTGLMEEGLAEVSVLDTIGKPDRGIFLNRQRRYLIFQKGASIVFQAHINKAIISGIPRGLNMIAEYSLTYDLPHSLEALRTETIFGMTPTKSNKSSITAMKPKTESLNFLSRQPVKSFKKTWPYRPNKYWQRKHFQTHRPCCTKKFTNRDNFKWKAKHSRWSRCTSNFAANSYDRSQRQKREQADGMQFENSSESLFYDLVGKWAEMHGYNQRHCIMRTLCEYRHVLLPLGHSLFHDLARILINHALPAAYRHGPFSASLNHADLQYCAHLYGPHCRVSLLQYFTNAVHGRLM